MIRYLLQIIVLFLFPAICFATSENRLQSLDEVILCARHEGADCLDILKGVIENSWKINSREDHFNFLKEGAEKLTREGFLDFALQLAKAAEAISIGNPRQLGELYFVMNPIFLHSGQLDSSLFYLNKTYRIFRDLGDSSQVGRALMNIGQIHKEKGEYPAAMNCYMRSMKIFRALKDEQRIARGKGELAVLCAMTGEIEKAIRLNKEAALYFKNAGDQYFYAYHILNLSNDLIYSGKEDTALGLLAEAISIFEEEEAIYMLMNAEAQLGRALYRLGKNAEGLRHFEKSNKLGLEQNFIGQLAYNYEFMSMIYRELKDMEKALEYSKRAYKLHRQIGLNEEYRNAVHNLAISYEELLMSDSAIKYYREEMNVQDTLFTIEKERQLNELKVKYEMDLKEEQLKSDKAQIALLGQQNRVQRTRNLALALGLILTLLTAVWIFTRQQTRMKHNRLIAMQSAKLMRAELTAKTEEEKRLKSELEHKQRELTNKALLMAEKNEMMNSFKEKLQKISENLEEKTAMNQMVMKIERAGSKTADWDKFMQTFEEVHPEFLKKLQDKYREITFNDIRLLTLMKMNFSNKEIASILHISDDGLKKARYRLRKKMNLPSEKNMSEYISRL